MRIVVLDGYTLNPGDLSWADLEALGPCEIYARTAPAELIPRAREAEILLTNKTPLGGPELAQLPKLKYIGILATGTNVVDLKAARERAIFVANVPAYGTRSVAQTTIALLLELTQHVGLHSESVRQGRWSRARDWCYWERPLLELAGNIMGIVGLGRIGGAVAELTAAFGMTVLAHTPGSRLVPSWVRRVELETLFRESDVLSLHCPLTADTHLLVNAERLSWMKPSALLLNTSRGPLIDEPALAAALNEERLAGAGLDVLSVEPPPPDHPLLHAKNCILTPHLAWATKAARSRLLQIALANVRTFLAGRPQNTV
jgi:glycerate dehydrogenase